MAKNWLKHVARMAFASSVGLAAGVLADVPPELLIDILASRDSSDKQSDESNKLMATLARDGGPAVRAAVAEAVSANPEWNEDTLTLLRTLTSDREPGVRAAATAAFVATVEQIPPLPRLELTASWATSEHTSHRITAARSLAGRSPLPAADLVLSHLVADPVPAVRRAAVDAASARFAMVPGVLCEIVEPAIQDSSPSVRSRARRAYISASRGTVVV
jgi:HEAT repeat protein